MKTIKEFCSKNGYSYKLITYKAQGFKVRRKGFDILDNKGRVLIALEPIDGACGNKWFVRDTILGLPPTYLKRISMSFLNQLNKIPVKWYID